MVAGEFVLSGSQFQRLPSIYFCTKLTTRLSVIIVFFFAFYAVLIASVFFFVDIRPRVSVGYELSYDRV